MKFVYNQILSCPKVGECADNLLKKIETLIQTKDHNQFHLSIRHVPNNHKIWLFLYSKNGIHEAEQKGKPINTKAKHVKKFEGKIPTKTELENL